jgi:DNA replication and repair protein RecF
MFDYFSQIHLRNWRCFSDYTFNMPDKSFVLEGNNGQGKSSILFAIYSLLTGKSWPETKFPQHLKSGSQYFNISSSNNSSYLTGQRSSGSRLTIKYKFNNANNNIYLTYQPTDNYWLFQSRSVKLERLNILLSQIYGQNYAQTLKEYNLYLKAKQNLIKNTIENTTINQESNNTNTILLQDINYHILDKSKQIWFYRREFLNYIMANIQAFFVQIDNQNIDKVVIRFEYSNKNGIRTPLFNPQTDNIDISDLNHLWQKELIAQKPLFGCHRDNFNFEINNLEIQHFLSRGQNRLFILFILNCAITFANLNCEIDNQRDIILLTDDLLNELDQEKEWRLINELVRNSQYLITTSALNKTNLNDLLTRVTI